MFPASRSSFINKIFSATGNFPWERGTLLPDGGPERWVEACFVVGRMELAQYVRLIPFSPLCASSSYFSVVSFFLFGVGEESGVLRWDRGTYNACFLGA